jgi:hypothetical protein
VPNRPAAVLQFSDAHYRFIMRSGHVLATETALQVDLFRLTGKFRNRYERLQHRRVKMGSGRPDAWSKSGERAGERAIAQIKAGIQADIVCRVRSTVAW